MSESNYDALRNSPRNNWTMEQKVTLCVLRDSYDITWLEIVTLFNALFVDELPIARGLTKNVLYTMRYQLRKDGFFCPGRWTTVRKSIEAKAFELGVHLSSKQVAKQIKSAMAMDTPSSSKCSHGLSSSTPRSRKRTFDDIESPSDSDGTLLGDEDSEPKTLTRLNRHPPAQAFDSHSQGVNSLKGFRAGLFVNAKEIPDSPNPNGDQFKLEAARHIKRKTSGVTPFVSVSTSLLRVYKYACSLTSDARIALVDLTKANGHEKFGKCNAVKNLNLQSYTQESYTGSREWLIWGGTDAIIGTVDLSKLEVLMTTNDFEDPFLFATIREAKHTSDARQKVLRSPDRPRCSFMIGKAVATLAKEFQVPAELLQDFVSFIANDWRIGTYWKQDPPFNNGFASSYQLDDIHEPQQKISSFSNFIASVEDFLDSPGVKVMHQDPYITTSKSARMGQAEASNEEEKMPTENALSMCLGDVKLEPQPESFGLFNPPCDQSGRATSEEVNSSPSGPNWKSIEGCGSYMLFYQ